MRSQLTNPRAVLSDNRVAGCNSASSPEKNEHRSLETTAAVAVAVAVVEHKHFAVAVVANLFVEQEFYLENIIAHHHQFL